MAVDARMAAELSFLIRARAPARAIRLTIRERVVAQIDDERIDERPFGEQRVLDAVERILRAAVHVQQQLAGQRLAGSELAGHALAGRELVSAGDLVETAYLASLDAVRGHGGETSRWIDRATRHAHDVLNELAAHGVEPLWARRVRLAQGWERW
jgi:hypothetical protein